MSLKQKLIDFVNKRFHFDETDEDVEYSFNPDAFFGNLIAKLKS